MIATRRSAEVYGLEVLAAGIEDRPKNQTRFVLVGSDGITPPSGHDKTSMLIYQRTDAPGSLIGILQEFAGRAINLTSLQSRPTKAGLGHYCFLVDCEGHVADELVADALRNLMMKTARVKFLGSYPSAYGSDQEQIADRARVVEAEAWVERPAESHHLIGSQCPYHSRRRDGRADDCDGLENRWALTGPGGSNPPPSAVQFRCYEPAQAAQRPCRSSS